MRNVCAKMVQKNLMTEQKANRRDVYLDLLDRLERKTKFFSRVITCDESWILEYDPQTKRQSGTLQTLPIPGKREWAIPKSNRCSFVFLTVRGSSTRNLCHQDSVNQTFYWEVLERLRKRVARVRPSIERTWMLHHDNVPCHTAVSINEFLADKTFLWFLSPPYSPELSPCDFFLFPRLKNHLKERHYSTLNNIQKSVTDELKGIPAEAFQHCYEQWKQCLRRCVAAQGNYFEGDNLDL